MNLYEKIEEKCCHCKHSKCMKNYCQCYAAGRQCTNKCGCIDCHNRKDNQSSLINQNNPSNSLFRLPRQDGIKEFKGCSCRKSYCIKKYCECFNLGLLCGQHCKCVDCHNTQTMVNKHVLNKLTKTNSTTSNKYSSLYPIILTPNTQNLNNLINEDLYSTLDHQELQKGIQTLFKSAQTGSLQLVLNQFINILKAVDNKLSSKAQDEMKQQAEEQKDKMSD